MTLSWKPPKEDGGAEITNYVVEYKEGNAFKWIKANKKNVPELQYPVKGLDTENQYEFHISAENKAGVGPASAPSKIVKAVTPVCKLIYS